MNKPIIWALFDTENGCYYNTLNKLADVYCVGLQRDGTHDNWNNAYSHKRENFISDIPLNLKFSTANTAESITFVSTAKPNYDNLVNGKKLHTSYAERSNIPKELILHIFDIFDIMKGDNEDNN